MFQAITGIWCGNTGTKTEADELEMSLEPTLEVSTAAVSVVLMFVVTFNMEANAPPGLPHWLSHHLLSDRQDFLHSVYSPTIPCHLFFCKNLFQIT